MLQLKYYVDKLMHDNSVFVLVGANNGIFVEEVFQFKLLNSKWECFLIEPIKKSFNKLIDNYNIHYPDNTFTYLNYAIHTYNGSGELVAPIKDDSFGMCSFFRPKNKETVSESVQCITVKNLVDSYPSMLKLDFLKTDAEEMDSEIILQFLDLNIYPKIIYFEHIRQNSSNIRSYEELLKRISGIYTIVKDNIDIEYEKYNILLIKNEYV